MDNILLIDKPSGITSFDVIRRLRKKLGIRKMGHAGTLDPLATGLMIIATGKSTKRLNDFLNLPKTYEVLVEFGKSSDTYDAQGKLTEKEIRDVKQNEFTETIKKFIGEIEQIPPIFSAIKVNGKRAYKLAREGKKIVLAARKVHVFSIDVLDWNWPLVRMQIHCSKGTYVRSIANDIGEALGCGGYVKELRRTAIGDFKVECAEEL